MSKFKEGGREGGREGAREGETKGGRGEGANLVEGVSLQLLEEPTLLTVAQEAGGSGRLV